MRETNTIMEFQKENENLWKPEYFIKITRVILPIAVGFLMGLYWIFGLIYYFT